MRQAVIIDAVRTPFGRYRGSLKSVRPDDMAAQVIRSLLERNPGVARDAIEDVILGCANQAGEDNRNVARMAGLLAELPVSVAGVTVNRLCGSSLEAVNEAAAHIVSGAGDVFIAGGVENMSRAPLVMLKPEEELPRGNRELADTTLGWRFVNPRLAAMYPPYSMGETAENVAELYHISREDQDEFALESQKRAHAAWEQGRFQDHVIPVEIPIGRGKTELFSKDEHMRPQTTREMLAKLPAAFRAGGTVTAGNSSGINDGAAAVLVMEKSYAESLGLKPRARIVSYAVAGVDPSYMGLGPIYATRKLLKRTGLSVEDLDLVELNEAFAAQSLACIRELALDREKVNVNGGAIALGHPLGASGARILGELLYELERREGRFGLATMCIGVGQGIATLIERL
ncbi:thiolase family protein [Sulfoacidibacillus thermotolerans]|uniref:acetyl-CoA C-acyltransferase n=1 Tax=Sulfoacidibacillus thermotolerans TaxID=1765684 RepID=A0A2U3D758_SULT2|nr:thiolase family protein [Sulfoacidibacillus thermotolerans]PWI57115.1 beta-ketoadipyl CoA thiolase [Sulfoacidibacillus thermotolerans]